MDSPSGASSGSHSGKSDGGDIDQRKQRRMISNRESARRSRMRKRKHVNDLTAQVSGLQFENGRIVRSVGLTNQLYLRLEAENSVLRAQLVELSSRLESLNGIISYVNYMNELCKNGAELDGCVNGGDLWDTMHANPPIMTHVDLLM